jgi:hypothetical protein
MKQTMVLELDGFGRTTIESQAERQEVALGALLREAVHYYLSDRETGRQGWRYPRFRRGKAVADSGLDVVVDVDDAAWAGFKAEADAQDVPVERLLEHAALYFVADLNSGRVTARILEDES